MEPKDDDFFVGIYDPLDVRRNMLESSKMVITSLQSFENIEKIREEKLKVVHNLKLVMGEIDVLVSKLRTRLPKSHLRKAIEPGNLVAPAKYTAKPNSQFSSELQRLEQELKSVERELSTMK